MGRVNEAHDGTRMPTTGILSLPETSPFELRVTALAKPGYSLMVNGRLSRFFNNA